MLDTRFIRITLAASAPFNALAAFMLAFPGTALGRFAGLPADVPALYAAITSFLVLLFGAVYAWLAAQPTINKPLLVLGAVGKSGVFALTVALWLADAASGVLVAVASGDLAFASIWFAWLASQSAHDAG